MAMNLSQPADTITPSTGTLTVTTDTVINGVRVGRGGSNVSSNTAVGASALNNNSSGGNNVAVGFQNSFGNSSGSNNVGIGLNALVNASTGSNNVGIGQSALSSNGAANNNTGVGFQTLNSNTASNNTAVGYQAGFSITSGSNNTVIGGYTGSAAPISATGSNHIVLSDGAGNVRQYIDNNGNFVQTVTGTAPTLATNSTLSFELTSNTSLKIVVRGTDGTTRSVSLTLA